MEKKKLVVIGNGMAGVRCVEEILKQDPDQFEITIFGGEPHPNYNRIMLSKVLQGDTQIADITINDWQWYKDHGIRLYAGDPVVRIDIAQRQVWSQGGVRVPYDKLILATGSLPFMLPLPGSELPGVTAFRDIKDCNTMMEASKKFRRAAVIGGGLLGLEAARGLLNLGMEVDVIHINEYLMERQLDRESAIMLRTELEKQGMRFLLAKHTERIVGKKRVEGLLFKDGSKIAVDLVVVAVGVRPNIRLAADSGIEVDRAILVNDYMQTNVPDVYAVGECAEHRGMVYGMVSPLYEQGKVLAAHLCGVRTPGYEGSILASHLKVSGVDVFSAGEIRESEIDASLKVVNGIKGTYKRVMVRGGKVVGAVLFGDSAEGNKLLGHIKQGADSAVLEQEGAGAAGGSDDELVCAMSDKETVCSCNGVSKGAIVSAIRQEGLETFEEVRGCTKASSSCGGCKPLVSAILAYTLANEPEPEPAKVTVCGCTSLSHEELRAAVMQGGYADARTAMQALGWQSADGCRACRPAVRYYAGLAASMAASAADAKAVEPSVALLADGTCSVTPRLYGGVATGDQLKRIAEVAERFGIPQVKLGVSGGIELRGVDPLRLTEVKAALGMQEASARYGKPVSPVATCGAPRYDGGAVRDSVALGERLERLLEPMQLPAEFAAAVSASPLHQAGTLTADLGLTAAPAGWEIYVGGSRVKELKRAELLGVADGEETALEIAAAFTQWYREEAEYGQRVWQWIEQVGIVQLREGLFDPVRRADLLGRCPSGAVGGILAGTAGRGIG
ncbi:nitrite reductase large subunit NirB [Paenibacillus methanolicus]|uniref:Nitrite reductase (NADH) large subunit n=1 Tax=Paenibacillus methanolicus TaxID=582686 RepID=A0A5S5BUB6_9BACL|nr:nitrite reductase large subunit NirB [Paenibacillus methanolicus]TYP70765.1 nitrite reductase (NADH) large subunit [Paenibacillus methanolicus]